MEVVKEKLSKLFESLKRYLEGFSAQRNAEAALWTGFLTFIGCTSSGLTWNASLGACIAAVLGGSFVEGRAFKRNQKAILKEKNDNEEDS